MTSICEARPIYVSGACPLLGGDILGSMTCVFEKAFWFCLQGARPEIFFLISFSLIFFLSVYVYDLSFIHFGPALLSMTPQEYHHIFEKFRN
jgi:hypothetical protein